MSSTYVVYNVHAVALVSIQCFCRNFITVLVVCIVSLIGKLTYMFLMSRVMSVNISLIVSKVVSCATYVELNAMYVLGGCKISRLFVKELYYSLLACLCIINHWSSQTDRKAARRSHVSLILLVSNLFPGPTA
jgi:hypothetical protein